MRHRGPPLRSSRSSVVAPCSRPSRGPRRRPRGLCERRRQSQRSTIIIHSRLRPCLMTSSPGRGTGLVEHGPRRSREIKLEDVLLLFSMPRLRVSRPACAVALPRYVGGGGGGSGRRLATGSCVCRETARMGRPRLVRAVFLSYLILPAHPGRRQVHARARDARRDGGRRGRAGHRHTGTRSGASCARVGRREEGDRAEN